MRICNGRNYVGSKKLSHLVWDHYNPDNPWRKGFAVHHKDGDKLNDCIGNLELMTRGKHTYLHHKGRICSEESRSKMSEANTGVNNPMYGSERFGALNPFYGKEHKEESKKKMSLSKIGKYCGADNPHFGKKHSDEVRERISEGVKRFRNKGKELV